MIDGFSLSFFFPLVVHALAGLTTGITGVLAFRASKRRGRHHRWGRSYLWAYTMVFSISRFARASGRVIHEITYGQKEEMR